MVRRQDHCGPQRGALRMLHRVLPGRDLHNPHAPALALLRRQPHLPLPAHLRRGIPRILSASRVRGKGQLGDNDSSRPCRLSPDRWRDVATNTGRYSGAR